MLEFVICSVYLVMKTVIIELPVPSAELWGKLSAESRQLLTEKALSSILRGDPYPTGTEQLELAIDLAEAGVEAEVISKISGLAPELFESFMRPKQGNMRFVADTNTLISASLDPHGVPAQAPLQKIIIPTFSLL